MRHEYVWTSRRTGAKGFSLTELLVVVALIAVMVGMAQVLFFQQQRLDRSRAANRQMVHLANEARNSALLLGSAAGTTRVQIPSVAGVRACPIEFSADALGTTRGRPALVVDMATASVTVIDRIERFAVTPAPANNPLGAFNYNIYCRTVDFREEFRAVAFNANAATLSTGAVRFRPAESSPANPTNNRYVLTYDSRGFINSLPNATAAIAMQDAQTLLIQRILVMASGYACLQRDQIAIGTNTIGKCRS